MTEPLRGVEQKPALPSTNYSLMPLENLRLEEHKYEVALGCDGLLYAERSYFMQVLMDIRAAIRSRQPNTPNPFEHMPDQMVHDHIAECNVKIASRASDIDLWNLRKQVAQQELQERSRKRAATPD